MFENLQEFARVDADLSFLKGEDNISLSKLYLSELGLW